MAALDAGGPSAGTPGIAARHADPRTTIHDRHRQQYDRHVAYAVASSSSAEDTTADGI